MNCFNSHLALTLTNLCSQVKSIFEHMENQMNQSKTDASLKNNYFNCKQNVALPGRNRTGPPCSVNVEL